MVYRRQAAQHPRYAAPAHERAHHAATATAAGHAASAPWGDRDERLVPDRAECRDAPSRVGDPVRDTCTASASCRSEREASKKKHQDNGERVEKCVKN